MLYLKLNTSSPVMFTIIKFQYNIQPVSLTFKNGDFYKKLTKSNVRYIDYNSEQHSQR